MMRARHWCGVLGIFTTVIAGHAMLSFGQQTRPKHSPFVPAPVPEGQPAEPARPNWALKVAPHPECPERTRELESQLAELLTNANLPEPDARLDFFSRIDCGESSSRVGWHGVITDIAPLPNGYLVTIKVNAQYMLQVDTQSLIERYAVTQQGIHFRGAHVPERAMPRLIFGF